MAARDNQFNGSQRRLWPRDDARGEALQKNAEEFAELGRLADGDLAPIGAMPPLVEDKARRGRPHKIRHPYELQIVWQALGGRGTHPSEEAVAEHLGVAQVRTIRARLRQWGLRWEDLPRNLERWTEEQRAAGQELD